MKKNIHRIAHFKPSFAVSSFNFSKFLAFFTPDNIVKIMASAAIISASLFITEASGWTTFFKVKTIKNTVFQERIKIKPAKTYGFDVNLYDGEEQRIKSGDTFFSILFKNGLTKRQADSLLKIVKKANIQFNKIEVGMPYAVFNKKENTAIDNLVFEPDVKRYIVFNFNTPSVKIVKRKVGVREFATTGSFDKTLWTTLKKQGMSAAMTSRLQDALKHKLDFKKIDACDEYKLIWEQETVEDRPYGKRKLKGLSIKSDDIPEPIVVFNFNNKGWFDKEGLPLRDSFLESPLKKADITSYYNLNRLHPVLHYRRPHLGTDYGAPYGTPIYSVADGKVKEARFSKSNGKYVKIEHKTPFASQYLHMSRFATGIRKGKSVKKGQVIGYVGATGLATGPHVCFRFWKQGEQVNHLKEKFFSIADGKKFKKFTDKLITRLDKIPLLKKDDEDKMSKQKSFQLRGVR